MSGMFLFPECGQIRMLEESEITREMFSHFNRRQSVTKCMRKTDGRWRVKEVVFTDDWNENDYCILIACLKNTAAKGGVVFGALIGGELKGFSSVEPGLLGSNNEYLDLSSLHVSEELRGKGIGKELFLHAKAWARAHGAQKLYISAHSAVESQAFYRAMGCIEALEYQREHVEKEPCDCQLECPL